MPYRLVWCNKFLTYGGICTKEIGPTDDYSYEWCDACTQDVSGTERKRPFGLNYQLLPPGDLEHVREEPIVSGSSAVTAAPLRVIAPASQSLETADDAVDMLQPIPLQQDADKPEEARKSGKGSRADHMVWEQKHNDWIAARFKSYAAANERLRIPHGELLEEFNAQYTDEKRRQRSLGYHISRLPWLRNLRAQYP